MTSVYGYGSDLVMVDGAPYPQNEIDCYRMEVLILFDDRTVIRVAQRKRNGHRIWMIDVLHVGSQKYKLTKNKNERAVPFSDVFDTNAKLVAHKLIKQDENPDRYVTSLLRSFL